MSLKLALDGIADWLFVQKCRPDFDIMSYLELRQ
jgi:hypothetical protein